MINNFVFRLTARSTKAQIEIHIVEFQKSNEPLNNFVALSLFITF